MPPHPRSSSLPHMFVRIEPPGLRIASQGPAWL